MQLDPLGVWTATDRMDGAQLAAHVRLVERLGYGIVWYPESRKLEPRHEILRFSEGIPKRIRVVVSPRREA